MDTRAGEVLFEKSGSCNLQSNFEFFMQYNQRQYNKDKWLTSKQSLLYSQKYETRLINPKEESQK